MSDDTVGKINFGVNPLDGSIRDSSPHTCPICYGVGMVDDGFYNRTGLVWSSSISSHERCRSCDGKGIVWRD